MNADGSIYHLHLKPEHVADTVLVVGDQARVGRISHYFDNIEYRIVNREFVTHTGTYKGKRITVASTGIGTDNVDIFMNELDAVVNIDLHTKLPKKKRTKLKIVRVGTSGALQSNIDIGAFVISEYAIGLDGLAYYYDYSFSSKERQIGQQLSSQVYWDNRLAKPYVIECSRPLLKRLQDQMILGTTVTAIGFYAPQERNLYLQSNFSGMNNQFRAFMYNNHQITNYEMETSALYMLSRMLGHECCSCNVILANRVTKNFAKDSQKIIDSLITNVLDKIVD